MFDRIEVFRRQLEARVRNTIKYAERGTQGLVGRAGSLVRRLDALRANRRSDTATVEWSLEPLRSSWSEFQHAVTRQPRRPVQALALAGRPEDPLYEIRKQLRLDYIARIAPRPEEVRQFLERQVPTSGAKEARFMELHTLDEFLAFDTARRYALTGEIPRAVAIAFRLEPVPGAPPHDSDWLRCSNFIVRRTGDARQGAIHA
jgi:hypothetical protein